MSAAWHRRDQHGEASYALAKFVGTAMFTRLSYRLRWPTRLRGIKLAAYIAINALYAFAFGQFVMPRLRRHADASEKLEVELGRIPSPEELVAALAQPDS